MYKSGEMNEKILSSTVKQLVLENFKTAEVFEKHHIDFCCGGNKTVSEACTNKNIRQETLLNELNIVLSGEQTRPDNYELWEPDFLIQYIVNNHHTYVKEITPRLAHYTKKIAAVHGEKYHFLYDIEMLFTLLQTELLLHMKKEENILFPIIEQLVKIKKTGKKISSMKISHPIEVMELEHDSAGERMYKIRELSSNFTLPHDACSTFTVTYNLLDEFEKDLHKHVFLENNVLFPKALQLEKELAE